MKFRAREPDSNEEAPWLQVAALPWRLGQGEIQFLLLSSRETKRWIIPKGWPMRGKTLFQAAATEAFEEGGLQGAVSEEALGHFHYFKKRKDGTFLPCRVQVFPFQVTGAVSEFPEIGQRVQQWFSRMAASEAVDEAELQVLILDFEPAIEA